MTDLPPDRAAHRSWLASLAPLPHGGTAADLGCGRGEELRLLAARHPDPTARFLGLDASTTSVAEAILRTVDARVAFREAALDAAIPLDDASVDLAWSHNLLECLPDPARFARELARVVRPGGRVVLAHWDWDTQLFDGADRALVRRLVTAWADWQQAWMAHADPWMGRRLRGIMDATGAFDGELHARVLLNDRFEPPWFGHANAMAMRSLVKRGLASAADVERFLGEQQALHESGRYAYAITGFAYVGRRVAAGAVE